MCVIARDEQASIGDCLASVRDEVDEIIVVDTGSRDRTAAVARSLGAAVTAFPWCDDFSAARNRAIELARAEFIFVMDCDERLTADSAGALRRLASAGGAARYQVRMVNTAGGDAPPGEQWLAVRLFRRDPRLRYAGRIHERLVIPGDAGDANELAVAPGLTLEHRGYQADLLAKHNKTERNARLLSLALAETAGDPVLHSLYLFYDAFGSRGDGRAKKIHSWVRYVEEHASLGRDPGAPWVAAGLAHHVWELSDQGVHGQAERRAQELLSLHGPSPILNLAVARARAAAGDYAEAEKLLSSFPSAAPAVAAVYRQFPLDVELIRRRGISLLGEIQERQGRLAEAEENYRQVVADEPAHVPTLLRLIYVQVLRGAHREALETIEKRPDLLRQPLPGLDCLALALSLIVNSPRRDAWQDRVQSGSESNPLASRMLQRIHERPSGEPFRLSDFPEIEHGIRTRLP